MRKTLLGGAVMAALVVPLALSPAANAAGGDQFIVNGDFSSPTVNGLLDTPNTTTDFALGDGTLGYGPDNGSMYDPGRYIIGTNPLAMHEAWIDLSGSTDPMLILNGFTEGSQKVWEQTVNTTPCTTAGSSIEFAFSANAMNILRDDWVAANAPGQVGGANISVTINGTQVGDTIDLLSNDPGNIVGTSGSIPAPADGVLDVVIWNNGVAYLGNDFAIDDITLTQVGDCQPPCAEYIVAQFEMPGWDASTGGKTFPQTLVSTSEPTCNPEFPPPPDCKNTQMDIFRADGVLTAAYLADGILTEAEGNDPALWAEMLEGGSANSWRLYPATNCPLDATANVAVTPPTCDAPSGVSLSGLLFATLVGSLDLSVGTHTATFKADAGHFFANGTDTLTVEYTINPKDTTSEVCIPDIGGKTIGFWTNKNGIAAGGTIWVAAKAPYANAIPSTWTFAQAQTALKASSSTNLGRDMLRAQFIATALNVQYINGYGDQLINVPASSAVDGGQTVSVTQYLADINAAWNGTALDTKAEITSVQIVLNAINQDVASDLFV